MIMEKNDWNREHFLVFTDHIRRTDNDPKAYSDNGFYFNPFV